MRVAAALPAGVRARLLVLVRPFARLVERLVFGGNRRERLLRAVVGAHYRSRSRRWWTWAAPEQLPHYTDHRTSAAGIMLGTTTAEALTRGFLAAEAMRPGDRVLDIGCGDGFFDQRFFSPRCGHVDAIDIDPAAIDVARRWNVAPNVDYRLADAVADPFPHPEYDVIVWDGALGHFAPATTQTMLTKIATALAAGGLFVGSESLGREEGHDHLQFFDSLEDFRALFSPHFPHVELRTVSYVIGGGFLRTEACWRCAPTRTRLEQLAWR